MGRLGPSRGQRIWGEIAQVDAGVHRSGKICSPVEKPAPPPPKPVVEKAVAATAAEACGGEGGATAAEACGGETGASCSSQARSGESGASLLRSHRLRR